LSGQGENAYEIYSSYENPSPEILADATRKILASIPSSFGTCVMISAGLVAALDVHYSIPAVAV